MPSTFSSAFQGVLKRSIHQKRGNKQAFEKKSRQMVVLQYLGSAYEIGNYAIEHMNNC